MLYVFLLKFKIFFLCAGNEFTKTILRYLLLYTRYEGALDPWLQSLWTSLHETNPLLLPKITDIIQPNLDILGDAMVEVRYFLAPEDGNISGVRS